MAKQKVTHMRVLTQTQGAQHRTSPRYGLCNPAARSAVMKRVPVRYLPAAKVRRETAMALAAEDIKRALEDAIAQWASAELRVGQVLS